MYNMAYNMTPLACLSEVTCSKWAATFHFLSLLKIIVMGLGFILQFFPSSSVTQNGSTFQEMVTKGAMINSDVNGALLTLITCGTRLCLYIYFFSGIVLASLLLFRLSLSLIVAISS